MEHVPVVSSNIKTVAYDHDTKTLHVRFKTTPGTYSYPGVSREIYDRLVSGNESPGELFHSAVRTKFKHTKTE